MTWNERFSVLIHLEKKSLEANIYVNLSIKIDFGHPRLGLMEHVTLKNVDGFWIVLYSVYLAMNQ
jgi:hypothetical protein